MSPHHTRVPSPHTGGKLDTRLYTNLITACARVGAVEQAFELYADMKQDRVKVCGGV